MTSPSKTISRACIRRAVKASVSTISAVLHVGSAPPMTSSYARWISAATIARDACSHSTPGETALTPWASSTIEAAGCGRLLIPQLQRGRGEHVEALRGTLTEHFQNALVQRLHHARAIVEHDGIAK